MKDFLPKSGEKEYFIKLFGNSYQNIGNHQMFFYLRILKDPGYHYEGVRAISIY